MLPNVVKGVLLSFRPRLASPRRVSTQLLIAGIRGADIHGYPLVGKLARFVDEQSPVYVGHQILLINNKVAQMPSLPLSCSFARLLNKEAAAKPENQNTQKNCQ
jgi:hypothetical protein